MIAIKAEVDRDRRPGRLLLTGSANVLMLPKVSESLAGRMEDAQGRLVGIEIKARRTLDGRDFRALRDLEADLPGRFHRGIVLYTGSETVSFGDRLQAMPVEALWRL